MQTSEKPVKLTVTLADWMLNSMLCQIASEDRRSVDEIVTEALREWLARREEQDDLAAIAATEGEETYPWEQVKKDLEFVRQVENDLDTEAVREALEEVKAGKAHPWSDIRESLRGGQA